MAMNHTVYSRDSLISKFSFINRNVKLKRVEFGQYQNGMVETVKKKDLILFLSPNREFRNASFSKHFNCHAENITVTG